MTESLVLIDGNNLVMRAYFSTHSADMRSPSGTPSGALYGAIRMTNQYLRDLNPTHMIWCFDRGGSILRKSLYPDYKGHRKTSTKATRPDPKTDLPPQYDGLRSYLDAIGVRHHREQGVEADDIIAAATKRWAPEMPVVIVSSDHDILQLVSETPQVVVARPRNGGGYDVMGTERVKEEWGVGPHLLPHVWALMGDPGDNVPGVPGVGRVTATKWIKKYGTYQQAVLMEKRCKGYEATSRMSYQLVELSGDVARLPLTLHDCAIGQVDEVSEARVLTEWGIHKSVVRSA